MCFQPCGRDKSVQPSFRESSGGGAQRNHIDSINERNWLREKILGDNAGASIFGFLNEQRNELSTLAARVAVVEKDYQELKEENHRLDGAKDIREFSKIIKSIISID